MVLGVLGGGFGRPEGPEIRGRRPGNPGPGGAGNPGPKGRKSGPPAEPGLGAHPFFFPSTFFPAFSTSFFRFLHLFLAFSRFQTHVEVGSSSEGAGF